MSNGKDIPSESKILVSLCELLIPVQENIGEVAKQASREVVNAIHLLDVGKSYEFAISAYVSTWGKDADKFSAGYGDMILSRLERLGDFISDINDNIAAIKASKKALNGAREMLISVAGKRSEFSDSPVCMALIESFCEQGFEPIDNQQKLMNNYLNAVEHLVDKAIRFKAVYDSKTPQDVALNSIAVADMVRKEVRMQHGEQDSQDSSDISNLRMAVKAMQAKFKERK